ncbi:TetR/AcrR family transcriptional regulator [Brevibacterium yomogidense]|uniref:TetR/AcrR family transcriptional regulator n=1 Tax=Brevibacterium yomogidense TaxID=946573 RepID=UPI0018DF1BBF|nr:TetR/AcrR family transcriptional regulator [Brevibacterium yomogidense]
MKVQGTTDGAVRDGRSLRWEQHRRTRRRELLRSARRAIALRGETVSMDGLAEATGTSKTVFYRYFHDRRGLQQAMGTWAMEVIRRSLDEAGKPDGTPEEALHAMIAAFVDLGVRSPTVYRFCDSVVTAEDGAGAFLDDVVDLLSVRMGLTGPTERLWARGAVGFVRSCTHDWLADPRSADRHSTEQFTTRLATWLWASRKDDA